MNDRSMKTRSSLAALWIALGAAAATVVARADAPPMPRNILPAYARECGSCHLAYPPGLLPATSWQRIMGGLEQHYGSDASLDAAAVGEISGWLQTNAGGHKRAREQPPQDRITRAGWFARKHREIAPQVWALPSVRSSANCAACHAGAERGRFGDGELQLPAGVPADLRRAWND